VGVSWELIYVYKESVNFGNDMFFEQLFKHQGYCLWDGDKQEFDDDGGIKAGETRTITTVIITAIGRRAIISVTIEYKGVWYGTVDDATKSNKSSSRTNKKVSYSSEYCYGWANDMEPQWAACGMIHSAAGAASVLVCGLALAKAYKRIRCRSVELKRGR
jgi:hypothetical protein